jgi:hypothetical protein
MEQTKTSLSTHLSVIIFGKDRFAMTTSLIARDNFNRAARKASRRDFISRLTGKRNDLIGMDELRYCLPNREGHYLGLKIIDIDKIVGSEGRYRDFDRAFYPRRTYTRDRWISIDKAHNEQAPLPPVDLFKVGEVYFVRDGNHRISVARAEGQDFIDAYVTEIGGPGSFEACQHIIV